MDAILILATIIAPVVLAVVEIVKQAPNYLPFVALIIGLLIGVVAFPFSELVLIERLWAGAIAGLAATGVFELGSRSKKIIESDE